MKDAVSNLAKAKRVHVHIIPSANVVNVNSTINVVFINRYKSDYFILKKYKQNT